MILGIWVIAGSITVCFPRANTIQVADISKYFTAAVGDIFPTRADFRHRDVPGAVAEPAEGKVLLLLRKSSRLLCTSDDNNYDLLLAYMVQSECSLLCRGAPGRASSTKFQARLTPAKPRAPLLLCRLRTSTNSDLPAGFPS